jgi:hypothetical protein
VTGPQYSSCVRPEDYVELPSDFLTGISLYLWDATDYMLHRKLVCCGTLRPGTYNDSPRLMPSAEPGSSCAIGRVVSFEPPSSKHGFESIDNDFSFNLLLRPDESFALTDDPFGGDVWLRMSPEDRLRAIRQGYEGEFLVEQPRMPRPREAESGDPIYGGYTSEMFYDSAKKASGTSAVVRGPGLNERFVWFRDGTVRAYPATDPGGYDVPVLHCECEGSRINDVFNVVDQMPGGGAGCKKHWYTAVLCWIARFLSLPFTLAFVAEAWAKARDGDYHDAMEGNGELRIGDLVLVRGRWVFDAGHKGYNEIHAVRTIQKIPERLDPTSPKMPGVPPPGSPPAAFDSFYRVWCDLADQAPPDHQPGQRPGDMTTTQTQTYDNQQRPENHYVVHPDIDGCVPSLRVSIERVEPGEVNRELGDVVITIIGTGFAPAANVELAGPSIVVEGSTVQGPTRIVATARVRADTPTGPRDVVVQNPDGSKVTKAGALVIYDRPIIR